MFWIILIGLFVLGYLFTFFKDLKKDDDDLQSTSLDDKFVVIVNMINIESFGGKGRVTMIDKREFNLYENGENQLIKFHYSTGHLTITWMYKYFQKEIVHERQFNDVRNLSVFEQQKIGKEIIREMSNRIKHHKKNVMGTISNEEEPIKPIENVEDFNPFEDVQKPIKPEESVEGLYPFEDCNDGTGYLKKKKVVKNNITYTLFERRYVNGKLWERYLIKNGRKEGECSIYEENGQLICKTFYKSGKRDGRFEEYYENGQLKEKSFYKEDKSDGVCEFYFKNGQLRLKTYCKNGLGNGLYEEYFNSGQLYIKVNLKDDKKNGPLLEYYKNGNLIGKGNFINDKMEGVEECYFENGQLKEKNNYENGVKQGHYEKYNETGDLKENGIYKDGKKFIDYIDPFL